MSAPAIFTASNGVIHFEGRPVSEYRAIAVRQHLVTRALDRSVSEATADAFWAVRNQLVAALTASRDQRRKSA